MLANFDTDSTNLIDCNTFCNQKAIKLYHIVRSAFYYIALPKGIILTALEVIEACFLDRVVAITEKFDLFLPVFKIENLGCGAMIWARTVAVS